MTILDRIKSLNTSTFEKSIEIRRHLHQNPELSFEEVNTQKFVKKVLKEIGIKNIEEKANTGIVAQIEGKAKVNSNEKGVIALRADMDALPIIEQNEVSYKSQNHGVMHACGHDVHTASLLGTAEILNNMVDTFSGTVKLIFQPGEERFPGGASLMIKEGALQNPTPKAIIGQHVMPFLPMGTVGFKKGKYMASADEIYITIRGKGGHAALPEHNVDPILIAAHLITAAQQVISRWSAPKSPTVLSFGKFIANGATNIIPNEVQLEGTFRAMDEKFRLDVHERLKKLIQQLVESMGGKVDIEIRKGYPYLENDAKLTQQMIDYAKDYLGEEYVTTLDVWMGAEDFAFYAQEMPACFYRLGTGNKAKNITQGVHHPQFNIDEDAFKISTGLMAWMAIQQLATVH